MLIPKFANDDIGYNADDTDFPVMNAKLNFANAKLNFSGAKLNFRNVKLNFRNAKLKNNYGIALSAAIPNYLPRMDLAPDAGKNV